MLRMIPFTLLSLAALSITLKTSSGDAGGAKGFLFRGSFKFNSKYIFWEKRGKETRQNNIHTIKNLNRFFIFSSPSFFVPALP
jgi:hypothetical protein